MSNYENNNSCRDCTNKYSYSSLANSDEYDCNQECICRNTNERSTKDIMDYNFYVMKKPFQDVYKNIQKQKYIFQK
jgi:superfamily II helicase